MWFQAIIMKLFEEQDHLNGHYYSSCSTTRQRRFFGATLQAKKIEGEVNSSHILLRYLNKFLFYKLLLKIIIYHAKMQQQKEPLSINKCITSIQSVQKYVCEICYDINTGIVTCAGPCSKYYCLNCVSDWIKTSNRCPSRCSQPFKVKPIYNFDLTFKCPFNAQKCTQNISSISAFEDHHRTCKAITQRQLNILTNKAQFLCKQGHCLQICKYVIGFSSKQSNSQKCGQCNEISDSRSFCRICHKSYCLKCRPIPCTKNGCPLGHKFKIQRKKLTKGRKFESDRQVCSVCGLSLLLTQKNYHDLQCLIRVCQVCYQNLPSKQRKVNISLINDYQKCYCKKKISYSQKKNAQELQCSMCKRRRICPKECLSCQRLFCLECKPVRIDRKKLCPKGHIYKKVYNPLALKNKKNKKRKLSQTQSPTNICCLVCFKAQTWLFQDKSCNIFLCQDCFEQSIHLSYDHHIPLQDISCKKGHKLEYFDDAVTKQDGQNLLAMNICKICDKDRISFLQCDVCIKQGVQEQAQSYCIDCRPIQFTTCYLGHPLLPFPIHNFCMRCEYSAKITFSCKKCNFQICRQCKIQNLKTKRPQIKKIYQCILVIIFCICFKHFFC